MRVNVTTGFTENSRSAVGATIAEGRTPGTEDVLAQWRPERSIPRDSRVPRRIMNDLRGRGLGHEH